MAYDRKIVKTVLADFELKSRRAEADAEKRKEELYKKIPELLYIDTELAKTSSKIVAGIINKNIAGNIEQIKAENLSLNQRRKDILTENSYKENYTDPQYECIICSDAGFLENVPCRCLKKALAAENIKKSGLAKIISLQTFDNFDINYYSGNEKDYDAMKIVVRQCCEYAEDFPDAKDMNLLLMGETGLGKTHLSTAMAGIILEKGFDIIYDTITNIISHIEKDRFNTDAEEKMQYTDCDLLIIDDLGSENTTSAVEAVIFNVINTRIIKTKNTIINTNLKLKELEKKYNDRIISRIFGDYKLIHFYGKDNRFKKLEKER